MVGRGAIRPNPATARGRRVQGGTTLLGLSVQARFVDSFFLPLEFEHCHPFDEVIGARLFVQRIPFETIDPTAGF